MLLLSYLVLCLTFIRQNFSITSSSGLKTANGNDKLSYVLVRSNWTNIKIYLGNIIGHRLMLILFLITTKYFYSLT